MKRLDWAFHDNHWVYLSSRGCYRHVHFLDEAKYNKLSVLQYVRDVLAARDVEKANLQAIHPSISSQIDIDYFTLRYFVATYGESSGLFFIGRSSTDTVSLNDDDETLDLSAAVLSLTEQFRKPITIAEIAEQLRGKSWPLTAMHVQKLIAENQVVRVDRSLYTTPKRAFDSVDEEAVTGVIDDVLRRAERPVEFDVFREQINDRLQLSYSKYFYGAYAKTHGAKLGWHVQRTLCSHEPIPWPGLRAAVRSIYDPSLDKASNLLALREAVLLTDRISDSMLAGWMSLEECKPSNPAGEFE